MKVLKLSKNQKDVLKDGAILDIWTVDGVDSIANTVKYLDINELSQAEKIIDGIKKSSQYKSINISNEKKACLNREIAKLDDNKIKNICFLLLSNNKKAVSVPKKTIYKLLVKTFNFTIKVTVVKSTMTCLGNETPEDTIWSFETVKDFIQLDDLIGCDFSDNVLKAFSNFMNSKKEITVEKTIYSSMVKVEKNIDEIKSDILDKLNKFLSSYTMKYISK